MACRPEEVPTLGGAAKSDSGIQAFEDWFSAEIDQAIKEADDPNTNWISNEEAKAGWARKRAELQAFSREVTATKETAIAFLQRAGLVDAEGRRSGSVDLNNLTPIDKCEGAKLNRCRVVHGGGRRLRRTHDAVSNSGRTNGFHFMQPL